jgi:hypothetical protein
VKDDLAPFLDSVDACLLVYLDEDKDLRTSTAEHLHRYALALLERLITSEHVMEDWEDFFALADAFVFAYGSPRLVRERAISSLVRVTKYPPPRPSSDKALLAELVEELSAFVAARRSAKDTTTRSRPRHHRRS